VSNRSTTTAHYCGARQVWLPAHTYARTIHAYRNEVIIGAPLPTTSRVENRIRHTVHEFYRDCKSLTSDLSRPNGKPAKRRRRLRCENVSAARDGNNG
jgi:hypothetical protein